ncbi:pre-rRNA-processing protein pno1 [Orbilia javanica]|uniref:Pre-rRNA-processing protein PNO1 n=1 Tax=Orbilia javanica TaxID=47235 RepID=A0AAN8N232_9PEZI
MPAPTALVKPVEEPSAAPQWSEAAEDIVLDAQTLSTAVDAAENPVHEDREMRIDEEGRPVFKPAKQSEQIHKIETRKVPVPPHRFSPLKAAWPKIYQPIVEHLKVDIRMNLATRTVEIRNNKKTEDPGALQKAADFVKVFTLGFDIDDAIALLRLDELYTETFEIKDVKTLQGEHLSRAIGRIAGKDGKTRFAIENATKTRIVLADSKIHILGTFQNIRMAREAVVSLILGAPPGKVYGSLRTVAARQKERF